MGGHKNSVFVTAGSPAGLKKGLPPLLPRKYLKNRSPEIGDLFLLNPVKENLISCTSYQLNLYTYQEQPYV